MLKSIASQNSNREKFSIKKPCSQKSFAKRTVIQNIQPAIGII